MVIRLTPAAPGFGLIELLVVVAILSVLTIGSTFLLIRPENDLNRIAGALTEAAHQTRHLAMVSGVDHALVFSDAGWTVSRRSGEGWSALTDMRPKGVHLDPAEALWILHADGRTNALALEISDAGETWRCRIAPARLVECQ